MGDFSPSINSGGGSGSTCSAKSGGWFEHKDLGTLFYKTDLNGYSARQFKTSINNIEQATLSDGIKRKFVLSDRGLYYLNNNEELNRIPIAISNLPINITNIEDNYIIDSDGSRYYLDDQTGIYTKSIVDNSGNSAESLSYYTSKALCSTFFDERNNEVKFYVTSNGSYASWLYENYEGDRTWNIQITDNGISFVYKASDNTIYAVKNNGTLNTVDYNNKTFNIVNCITESSDAITGINYVSELHIQGNNETYLFLMTNSGIYYTQKSSSGYDLTKFKLLNKISYYQNGSWISIDSTVSNVSCLKKTSSIIVFASGSSLYCIHNNLSYIQPSDGSEGFLSIIKNTTFNESGVCNILIYGNNIFTVTKRSSALNVSDTISATYNKTIIDDKQWYNFKVSEYSKLSTKRKKKVPENWRVISFYNRRSDRNGISRWRFKYIVSVQDRQIVTNYTITFNLHKISISGNSFTSDKMPLSDSYSYNKTDVTTRFTNEYAKLLVTYKKNVTADEKSDPTYPEFDLLTNQCYITQDDTDDQWDVIDGTTTNSSGDVVTGSNSGTIFGFYNQDHKLVTQIDGVDVTWNTISYNTQVQATSTSNSNIDENLLNSGKVISHKTVPKVGYFNGFHDVRSYKDGVLMASPFGLLYLNSNNKLDTNNSILIDFTGDTDFREMYELNYKGGNYEGDWFVFTTSDGLLSCRAGDPSNPLWQPDWHIFKYGTSFWKIRCSSSPHRDKETGKKMVEFSNFSVKYPSYIY